MLHLQRVVRRNKKFKFPVRTVYGESKLEVANVISVVSFSFAVTFKYFWERSKRISLQLHYNQEVTNLSEHKKDLEKNQATEWQVAKEQLLMGVSEGKKDEITRFIEFTMPQSKPVAYIPAEHQEQLPHKVKVNTQDTVQHNTPKHVLFF